MPLVYADFHLNDKKYARMVRDQMAGLDVDYWDQTDILAGQRYKEVYFAQLNRADVVVLFVSADYLVSDEKQELLKVVERRASEGTLGVYWLSVRPCLDDAFHKYRLLNPNGPLSQFDEDGREAAVVAAVHTLNAYMNGKEPASDAVVPDGHARIDGNTHELCIKLREVDGRYRVVWDGEEQNMVLPLGDPELRELEWYLATYPTVRQRDEGLKAKKVEESLKPWGERLFQLLFAHDVGATYFHALIGDADTKECVITLQCESSALMNQPWELMRYRDMPLHTLGIHIRRQVNRPHEPIRPKGHALRVLLVTSRPTDQSFVDARVCSDQTLTALKACGAQVTFCFPPTLEHVEDLAVRAREEGRPYHVFHFDGHGIYNRQTGFLVFENHDRTQNLVSGARLGELLYRTGISLFIMGTCMGAKVGGVNIMGSVGPALLHAGAQSVVAFRTTVYEESAFALTRTLYQQIAAGANVRTALSQGRRVLDKQGAPAFVVEDLGKPFVWFLPQLYQQGEDVPLVKESPQAPRETVVPRHIARPQPPYGFYGREEAIWRFTHRVHGHPVVAVHGEAGVGKTLMVYEAAAWWLRVGLCDKVLWCDAGAPAAWAEALGLDHCEPEAFVDTLVAAGAAHRYVFVWDHIDTPTDSLLRFHQQWALLENPLGRVVYLSDKRVDLPRIARFPLKGLDDDGVAALTARMIDMENPDLGKDGRDKLLEAAKTLAGHPGRLIGLGSGDLMWP